MVISQFCWKSSFIMTAKVDKLDYDSNAFWVDMIYASSNLFEDSLFWGFWGYSS